MTWASSEGRDKVINILLEKGKDKIDFNVKDRDGKTGQNILNYPDFFIYKIILKM